MSLFAELRAASLKGAVARSKKSVAVERSSRSGSRSELNQDSTCRARARSRFRFGNSRFESGNASSRYSTMAFDSVSQNPSWMSAGTRAVTEATA